MRMLHVHRSDACDIASILAARMHASALPREDGCSGAFTLVCQNLLCSMIQFRFGHWSREVNRLAEVGRALRTGLGRVGNDPDVRLMTVFVCG